MPLAAQTVSQMVDNVLSQPEGKRLMLLAPIIKERKGEHTKTLENLASGVTFAPVLTAKSAISPIRRSWSYKRNIPLRW